MVMMAIAAVTATVIKNLPLFLNMRRRDGVKDVEVLSTSVTDTLSQEEQKACPFQYSME